MTSPTTGDELVLEARPDETADEFLARVIAAAGRPDASLAAELRRLLPPITAGRAEHAA